MLDNSITYSQQNTFNQELAALQQELSALIIEKDNMLSHTKISLEMRYYTLLGKDRLELLNLEIEYRKLKRTCELIQSDLNKNQKPNIDLINSIIEKEMSDWSEKIREMKNKIKHSEIYYSNFMSEEDSKEITRIYRNLVKQLHPDLNPNASEEKVNLWHKVQNAYKSSDLLMLKHIWSMLGSDFDINEFEKNDVDIDSRINNLKKNIQMKKNEIEVLKLGYPFNLSEKLWNEDWINSQKEEINFQKENFKNLLEKFQIHYSNLMIMVKNGKFSNN